LQNFIQKYQCYTYVDLKVNTKCNNDISKEGEHIFVRPNYMTSCAIAYSKHVTPSVSQY